VASRRTLWDRLGRAWDGLWYTSPRRTAQEVGAIIAALDLRGGERVLDIGCGTGRHSVRLARLGWRVVGVDRSAAMLAVARAKAARARVLGRTSFILADAAALPFSDGRFDVALSLCEGAFGADEGRARAHAAILREAARALAPGGRLVLVALERRWLDRHGDWRYDPRSGRHVGREMHALEGGARARVAISTRALRWEEAARSLRRAGLRPIGRAGAAPGRYAALAQDDPDAMQYMLIATKERR
jgi:SAM-dependent methyltransferase